MTNKYLSVVDKIYSVPTFIIFHIEGCPYCASALSLLVDKKLTFRSFKIEAWNKAKVIDSLKTKIGDYNTFPLIFIGDNFIGGSSDLKNFLAKF